VLPRAHSRDRTRQARRADEISMKGYAWRVSISRIASRTLAHSLRTSFRTVYSRTVVATFSVRSDFFVRFWPPKADKCGYRFGAGVSAGVLRLVAAEPVRKNLCILRSLQLRPGAPALHLTTREVSRCSLETNRSSAPRARGLSNKSKPQQPFVRPTMRHQRLHKSTIRSWCPSSAFNRRLIGVILYAAQFTASELP